ncbi:MAG: DegT/DnrJ/EryC1/StrS family aminotransferase [Chloroflexi bacterium]|nr:DegT/DnrJ/EryC1/StrS family aminotransferase [Chloroflexota bacterium]MBV9895025.1 DegT/DnrJ/EryC1/StrS family aminotransferase [Chloroflexota bacterium]
MSIPIAQPMMGPEEAAAVQAVLASGELAQGRWVREFEETFAAYCGAKFAVATSSGTTALHLALLAHRIGPGDEVITTPFTFVASSNAILYVGATPVFADIDPRTFNIDPTCVEQAITRRTRAIIPVDLFGHPADLPRLRAICEAHNLVLIEDACQAHGACVGEWRAGSTATACFSFYPTKNMTTGEGGIVTTDSGEVADAVRLLRQHGSRQRYIHDVLGFNFRMTNMQAAIGLVQLTKLDGFNARRISNAAFLTDSLKASEVVTPTVRHGVKHVFHQFTIRVSHHRDELQSMLSERGVESRVYYPVPVHKQPLYAAHAPAGASFPEAERAAAEVLSLPVHPSLSDQDLHAIADAVVDTANRFT